jgi:RNA polymerase-binding transcription factor DksA
MADGTYVGFRRRKDSALRPQSYRYRLGWNSSRQTDIGGGILDERGVDAQAGKFEIGSSSQNEHAPARRAGKEERQMSHLTQKQLDQLKKKLNDRYQILLSEVHEELDGVGKQNLKGLNAGTGDAATNRLPTCWPTSAPRWSTVRSRQCARSKPRAKRMRDGSYGECINCGSEIPFERLLAYPTALRDVPCQNQYEKNYAHEGRPTL